MAGHELSDRNRVSEIQLEGPRWEAVGRHVDPTCFFRALERLVPDGAILCLEGGAHPPALREFVAEHAVAPQAGIARGTAWPKAQLFHVPATAAVLRGLATLAEACAQPEICEHLHVYDRHGMLLEWYDAFSDPFSVSQRLPRGAFEMLCRDLGTSWQEGAGRRDP